MRLPLPLLLELVRAELGKLTDDQLRELVLDLVQREPVKASALHGHLTRELGELAQPEPGTNR